MESNVLTSQWLVYPIRELNTQNRSTNNVWTSFKKLWRVKQQQKGGGMLKRVVWLGTHQSKINTSAFSKSREFLSISLSPRAILAYLHTHTHTDSGGGTNARQHNERGDYAADSRLPLYSSLSLDYLLRSGVEPVDRTVFYTLCKMLFVHLHNALCARNSQWHSFTGALFKLSSASNINTFARKASGLSKGVIAKKELEIENFHFKISISNCQRETFNLFN